MFSKTGVGNKRRGLIDDDKGRAVFSDLPEDFLNQILFFAVFHNVVKLFENKNVF